MLLCHCEGVTDRDVRAAHAGGACTPEDVARCSGAAQRCGGCLPALMELVEELAGDTRLVHAA